MKKICRIPILALLAFSLNAEVGDSTLTVIDHFKMRVLTFDKNYDVFIRKLFGCQLSGFITRERCLHGEERIDYEQYDKAREAAKKLFDLGEPNGH